MKIGIPTEIKRQEYRVGATPEMVQALVESGHDVVIQNGSGEKIGLTDELFLNAGARICKTAAEVWDQEFIVKVKEPLESEWNYLKKDQILFCYLHLAPDAKLTRALVDKKIIGIAYETVIDRQGNLPLLLPMSEIAGRLSVQAGAEALGAHRGGRGLLIGGVPGVLPSQVVIIGAGISGTEAAKVAMGLGANVTILDKNLSRLRQLDLLFGQKLKTLYSSTRTITEILPSADLVIGAILVPGKTSPKIITREHLKTMKKGSVVVDISIDQGGCVETSRPTTHENPTFIEEGVIHYCVANMPGACALTATSALVHATLDYVLAIADLGYRKALKERFGLIEGLNVYKGHVTNSAVAEDLGYEYRDPKTLF